MNFRKKLIITLSSSTILLGTLCFGQESYLIKKNINKNTSIDSTKKKKSEKLSNKEVSPTKTKDTSLKKIEKKKETIEKEIKQFEIVEEKKLRIIYKPNQLKLEEKALIKIIELSNSLGSENFISLISYASKNNKEGSSDARRLSLSRALEVRKVLIENEILPTNISVRALGTKKNDEGFTDIVIITID